MLLLVFAGLATALLWRALDLQVLNEDFLQQQGAARYLRVVEMPAHRGAITDRHGQPLAISSPVDSVWANPGELLASGESLAPLARLLGLDAAALHRRLEQRASREFVYIKRHVTPELGEQVQSLGLPGVALQREYRRFYPAGEVAAHVVGFTNVDDIGQEGMELAYDDWLRGDPGAKRVVKDRLGRIIDDVESLREPKPGEALTLSIDRRLQYLAYRELKTAVTEHGARAAALVMLDAQTGEVLAMVNQPAYNPNNRAEISGGRYRNRAVTDSFEPASTLKPFAVLAALESGAYGPDSIINTSPGVMRVDGHTVRDPRDYGRIDVATVIEKSSNVGVARMALNIEADAIWGLLLRLGLGAPTGTTFPGEAGGSISGMPPRSSIDRAALAYGYGVAVTPLQLAQAYTVLAADGIKRPVSFLKLDQAPVGERILDAQSVRRVRGMMEAVVSDTGTASRAQIPGYRVAGKTGTAKKAVAGGYSDNRYVALFAGMAPASAPRLVLVVVVDEPVEDYYGGKVAAPIFAKVMGGALRLLNVPPDDVSSLQHALATRRDA